MKAWTLVIVVLGSGLLAAQDKSPEDHARGFMHNMESDNAMYRNYGVTNLGGMADRLSGAVLDEAIAAVEKLIKDEKEEFVRRSADEALKSLKEQKANPRKPRVERDIADRDVDAAIEKAVKYVVGVREKGGDRLEARTLSFTAIPVKALLDSPHRDRKDVQAVVVRDVRALLADIEAETFKQRQDEHVKIKEGAKSVQWAHFTSDCAHVINLFLQARSLKAFESKEDQRALDHAIKRCIQGLRDTQDPKTGGWWKYTSDQPLASFMVSDVMLALAEAKKAGFDVGEKTLANAIKWMQAQADGGYRYLGDAISRRVAGELALVASGAERKAALTEAVDRFFNERAILEDIRLRKGTHQSDFGSLSTTGYMFGYYHAAAALAVLGKDTADKYGPVLEKTFVNNQEADGRWRCGPQPDSSCAYETARGLQVLTLARRRMEMTK